MNDAFIEDPSEDNPLILGENREQDADEDLLNLGFVNKKVWTMLSYIV